MNILSALFICILFSFWFPGFHKHAFVFNCSVSKYGFKYSAPTSKTVVDQLSFRVLKHLEELGILAMHHEVHPERPRCSSGRDRTAQSFTVTGLASPQNLSGRAHIFLQPFVPRRVSCHFGNG